MAGGALPQGNLSARFNEERGNQHAQAVQRSNVCGYGVSGLLSARRCVSGRSDWYPPCGGEGSGIGGIIGCAEQAACRNADCHHLACITNGNDCCERGHAGTYCWWKQWFTAGHNLEHVTCDVIYAIELAQCIPYGLLKELFGWWTN